jgi:hypothetical protein
VTAWNVHTNALQHLASMPARRDLACARYKGSGHPKRAESASCERRFDPLAFKP